MVILINIIYFNILIIKLININGFLNWIGLKNCI